MHRRFNDRVDDLRDDFTERREEIKNPTPVGEALCELTDRHTVTDSGTVGIIIMVSNNNNNNNNKTLHRLRVIR